MVEIKENIRCFQYMFFYLFISFSFIYLRIISKNSPEENVKEYLVKITEYWKKKPIWKMKVINDEDEEPENMEKYSFGIWPGTYKGCNCTKKYEDYYKDFCSQENVMINNCSNLEEQSAINIYKYYFRYYVTYYDSDYLTLLTRVEGINKCKTGYKKCGLLDTIGRSFCVKEEEDCVMNHFFFKEEGEYIYLYYGFDKNYTETNKVVNNLIVTDHYWCLLDEEYFEDDLILFKKKTDGLAKCSPNKEEIFKSVPNSDVYKSYLYKINNIYNGDGIIPGRNTYSTVSLYSMIYYGLNDMLVEYYNYDITIFKNLKLFNILIFIILKVGIQFGYFLFIQKSNFKNKIREIIYNIIWAFVFVAYLVLIWIFNNSLYRTSLFIFSEYSDNNLYEQIKILKIIDIICGFIILATHIIKFVSIIFIKDKKKFSEFINEDK